MNETNSKQLIYPKMIAIMKDIKAVKKDRVNVSQNYQYRGIEDFINQCHPVFANHGVFLTTYVKDIKREDRPTRSGGINIYTHLMVEFTFHAEDGSCIKTEVPGEAMDSGDKSTNKALSAALKYCLAQMLLVPFDMLDSEKDSPEVIPSQAMDKAVDKLTTRMNMVVNENQLDSTTNNMKNLRSTYLNMLAQMQKDLSQGDLKKLSPTDLWVEATYIKGIEYLTNLLNNKTNKK